MSGRKPRKNPASKGSKASAPSGQRRVSKSEISNLLFPVPRVKAMLKVNNYANRVSDKAAVFLTSALEYAAAEILELSLNQARSRGRTRIHSKHVNAAVKTDPELMTHFRRATFAAGGAVCSHQAGDAAHREEAVPPAKKRKVAKEGGKTRRHG